MKPASGTTPPHLARREFLRYTLAGSAAWAISRHAGATPDSRSRLAGGTASATARGAAILRALHQVIDYPRVLDDPLALPIIGDDGRRELQAAADRGSHGLRAFVALRSRYAEDRLAAAVAQGTRQYVVLGAGLDTFAYRNPHAASGLHVFEVDHPATQHWKRSRLKSAGIPVPPRLTFVPVDFETQTLSAELQRAGFRSDRPAFFSMLGVVVYLTKPALMDTLRLVAAGAPGTEIAFSFSLPDSHLSEAARLRRERSAARMAALGEPWQTYFDPDELTGMLRETGFARIDILNPGDGNARYFAGRPDRLRLGASGHMAAAGV